MDALRQIPKLAFLKQIIMATDDTYAQFNDLLSSSYKMLLKLCLHYTDRQPDNVQDLYQEIAYNLWKSFPTFQGQSKPTTWVYRIALNTALSQIRQRPSSVHFVSFDQEMLESIADEAQDDRTAILYDIIHRLPSHEQVLFDLYLDDLSFDEISDVVGRTPQAVKQKIQRIKNKIRKEYERLDRI